jgi:hypothetical protein
LVREGPNKPLDGVQNLGREAIPMRPDGAREKIQLPRDPTHNML